MNDKKRRDLKGRILDRGESQIKKGKFRGRYQFDYYDINGTRKHVNSWRLFESDPQPWDKRRCKPLRTLEKEIRADLEAGIDRTGGNRTLNDEWKVYITTKTGVTEKTKKVCCDKWNNHMLNTIGTRKLSSVKYSDVKAFLINMVNDGYAVSTVCNYYSMLHAVFDLALRDDLIRKNPCDGAMKEIKKTYVKSEPRHALTKAEQTRFIMFCKASPKWSRLYPLFAFMFGTGCRVAEAVAITWNDIDMKNGIISVNHALEEWTKDGKWIRCIKQPKTRSGVRDIPITSDLARVLEELQEVKPYRRSLLTIDGHSDFVFLNQNNNVYNPSYLDSCLKRMVIEYNAIEEENAHQEQREPLYLPPFTCHNIRHTFCTRLCESGADLKAIQSYMGHSNISTTMNIYAECTGDHKKEVAIQIDDYLKMAYSEDD